MSDPSSPSYHRRRTYMEQLTGGGPGSTRSELSVRMAERQIAQRIMWGELNPDGTRR